MKYVGLLLFSLLSVSSLTAQKKKPLDHSVYDGWKSVGERLISHDGKYIVYTIVPQEGDGEMVIENISSKYKKTIPRAGGAVISNDSRFVFFRIKPYFQDSRKARIKKKKPDEMPKDSLGIVELGKDSVVKVPRLKSFMAPEKGRGWLAYQLEKPLPDTAVKKMVSDSAREKLEMLVKAVDSIIRKSIDSINGKIERAELIALAQKAAKEILKKGNRDELLDNELNTLDAEGDDVAKTALPEGSDLVVRNLADSKEKVFKWVNEFSVDKKGTVLLIETTKNPKDTLSKARLLLYRPNAQHTDTIFTGFNDCKNFAIDEEGNQFIFLAERDSSSKALQKFYKLWYYSNGQDSARLLADKTTAGMRLGFTVSENGMLRFSKDGKKIFFGVAPMQPPKDTTLVDFELARLDVWHYNDDYLQPQQLKQLDLELKRNYLAVALPGQEKIIQLGDDSAENITLVNEGNADYVLANTTRGNRIQAQWTGRALQSGYLVNIASGAKTLVKKDVPAFMRASPQGKFIYWYDPAIKNYFTYEVATGTTRHVTEKIKVPLYDTENDVPDYPDAAGITGWTANDRYLLVNDEYDIWQVDPTGNEQPKNLTNGFGKKNNTTFSYQQFDPEKRFFETSDQIVLRGFNKISKYGGFFSKKIDEAADPQQLFMGPFSFNAPVKADSAEQYLVQKADISASELFATPDLKTLSPLTTIASQQANYNWLTVELVKWKMFDGKMSEGLLYKPANFDPKKKYPVIFYFYERNADGLYNYRAPAPSASTVNVPYFVSNGYLVFDPNIYYKTGEPGQSAYNSVVSAAKYLSKMPWVDSTRLGIQGQSWGGYQVAYLITRTNIFRAAGAGAPVANMTSAYGGIRWGPGINRQFQYEKTQSRIGATLWQRPDLYIKNSPLFQADKITTPVLITHNDADDAVPWYQGIEFFTALRRLHKKVWMLEYNGEAHNLVERRNRKDLSVRLGQFFDYYLKDAPPARWIKEGLPATAKGKDWGLEVESPEAKAETIPAP